MNQLIAMSVEMTMSSVEISELTGKRHDNVMRDTRNMLSELGVLKSEETYIHPRSGRRYRCFFLTKDESICLVAGYSAKLRMAIIKRWQDLEAQAKQRVPQTYAAALLEAGRLAAELEQKHELVLSKGEPQTLTQLVGRAAVRGANSWLLENGYVTTSVDNGWRVWFLTEKGKEFGVKTKERNLRWAVELLDILPPQNELLERY